MQRYPSALRLRSNRFSPIIVTVATCLCFAAAGFAASGLRPPLEGVSPGDRERVAPIRDGCPTFSWAAVPGAQAHELAVYRFTGNAANAAEDPVLTQRVPATFSWTPDLDACLEAGRYAWVVRARTEVAGRDWSEPRHFEVKTGSSSAELRKVVEDVLAEWLTEKRIPLAEANALRSVPLSNYSPSGGKGPQPLAEAAFTPAPCQAGQEVFADVAASSPYCAAIQQLYADQLTAGCATGPLRFCPDLPVLRKHVALFLEKAFHAKDALQIDAGGEFACGIKSDGRVVCWGFNGDGQVSPVPPGTYTQISAGSSHACGVLTNGTVVCWGLNTSAQVSPVTAGAYTRVSAGGSAHVWFADQQHRGLLGEQRFGPGEPGAAGNVHRRRDGPVSQLRRANRRRRGLLGGQQQWPGEPRAARHLRAGFGGFHPHVRLTDQRHRGLLGGTTVRAK